MSRKYQHGKIINTPIYNGSGITTNLVIRGIIIESASSCASMIRSFSKLAVPMQRMVTQMASRGVAASPMQLFARPLSTEANEDKTETAETPAEEISQPVAHNKFAHVCFVVCAFLTI